MDATPEEQYEADQALAKLREHFSHVPETTISLIRNDEEDYYVWAAGTRRFTKSPTVAGAIINAYKEIFSN